MKFLVVFVLGLMLLPGWSLAENNHQISFNRGYFQSTQPPVFDLTNHTELKPKEFSFESKSVYHGDCVCPDDLLVQDVAVYLSGDHDRDGYFHFLKTELDLDLQNDRSMVSVFVVLSLSYEGGPWKRLYTSDPIQIEGSSRSDTYIIESHLRSGYATGIYDLLIDVYETKSGHHLLSQGPYEDHELHNLPLEAEVNDSAYGSQIDYAIYGSGSMSWLVILLLAMVRQARTYRVSEN